MSASAPGSQGAGRRIATRRRPPVRSSPGRRARYRRRRRAGVRAPPRWRARKGRAGVLRGARLLDGNGSGTMGPATRGRRRRAGAARGCPKRRPPPRAAPGWRRCSRPASRSSGAGRPVPSSVSENIRLAAPDEGVSQAEVTNPLLLHFLQGAVDAGRIGLLAAEHGRGRRALHDDVAVQGLFRSGEYCQNGGLRHAGERLPQLGALLQIVIGLRVAHMPHKGPFDFVEYCDRYNNRPSQPFRPEDKRRFAPPVA